MQEVKSSILIFHSKNVDTYDRLVESCARARADGVALVDADSFLDQRIVGPKMLLTFDDGYESLDPKISKFLRENSFKAIAFVIPLLGDASGYRFDWKYYRENDDVFEVGSHSMTHSKVCTALVGDVRAPAWSRLGFHRHAGGAHENALTSHEWLPLLGRTETEREYETRVRSDLWMSKNVIERMMGRRCRFFAYPWGAYNDTLKRIVAELGYQAAFSTTSTDKDIYSIRRTVVT